MFQITDANFPAFSELIQFKFLGLQLNSEMVIDSEIFFF